MRRNACERLLALAVTLPLSGNGHGKPKSPPNVTNSLFRSFATGTGPMARRTRKRRPLRNQPEGQSTATSSPCLGGSPTASYHSGRGEDFSGRCCVWQDGGKNTHQGPWSGYRQGWQGRGQQGFGTSRCHLQYGIGRKMLTENPVRSISGADSALGSGSCPSGNLPPLARRCASSTVPAPDIIKLLALTGCRRGEIANLRWREV